MTGGPATGGSPLSRTRPVPNDEFGLELVRDWAPDGQARASVVIVHGIAEHSGRYEAFGSRLAGAGFRVRAFDLRGAGASGGQRWHLDEWGQYHDQLGPHVQWAREQGDPVVLVGFSMGGNVALGFVLDRSPKPDLLVLSGPALGGGERWQRALAAPAARLLPRLRLPNRITADQLSRDPAVGEAYFSDPLVDTRSTVKLGALFFEAMDEVSHRVDELDIPTLVLHGGLDTAVPPESTAALGRVPVVDRRLYPKLRHEVLNEPEGPEITQEIIDWLDDHI